MMTIIQRFIFACLITNTVSSSSTTTKTTKTNTQIDRSSRYFHQYQHFLKTTTISNSQQNIIHRYLQDNTTSTIPEWTVPTYPPTSSISDNDICNAISSRTYRSTYDKMKSPCSCQRTSGISTTLVNNINVTIPGTFDVICDYQYCTECYNAGTTDNDIPPSYCGTLYTNYTYYENIQYPTNPISKDGYECITVLNNNTTDKVCLQTFLNTSNILTTTTSDDNSSTTNTRQGGSQQQQPEFSCNIYVNEQMCTSCEFVLCTDYPNEPFAQQLLYNCSNIDGGYSMNTCDYLSENSDSDSNNNGIFTFNETILSDPLLYFNPINNPYTFETCYNELLAPPPLSPSLSPLSSREVLPTSSESAGAASSPSSSSSSLLLSDVPILLLLFLSVLFI